MKVARAIVASVGLVALGWMTGTAALLAMPVSCFVGVASFVGLIVAHRTAKKRFVAAALLVAAPVILAEIALPEFVDSHASTSCRVRAALGDDSSCDAPKSGAVLTTREHLAYRWLNLNMAAGGWMLGFREVAWETVMLDRLSTSQTRAEVQSAPIIKRRGLCRGGAAAEREPVVQTSDFAMDDLRTQRAVKKLARSTRDGQERWESVKYTFESPWHVWFALLVPGSKIHAKRNGDTLDLWYRGSIQYPPHVIVDTTYPSLFGRSRFLLDEAPFCGLQMDGVFVPFVAEWRWSMDRTEAKNLAEADQPRLIERVAEAAGF